MAFRYMDIRTIATPVVFIYIFGIVEEIFVLEMQHEERLFSVLTRQYVSIRNSACIRIVHIFILTVEKASKFWDRD
jgi:hypothetical protein